MTTTVDSILARAAILLQDTAHTRWPLTELLDWLNDGQREIVLRKPNANVVNATVALAAGTKQTLPASAVQLFDVVRNVPGSVVRGVDRALLDALDQDWHDATAAAKVQHFCYEPTDPKHFYVYPPNTGTGQVELAYSAIPTAAALGGSLPLDDIYQAPLIDYVLYRAYAKDSEQSEVQRVVLHYAAFDRSLSGKAQLEQVPYPGSPQQG